jgi:hypothetical protein
VKKVNGRRQQMGSIAPKLTRVDLETSGRHTMNGTGTALDTGLPAVTADAKEMDPEAHKVNRELAKQIQELVARLKPSDGGVPRFVLAWRMYPNADSTYWDDSKTEHACGCGCGCPVESA